MYIIQIDRQTDKISAIHTCDQRSARGQQGILSRVTNSILRELVVLRLRDARGNVRVRPLPISCITLELEHCPCICQP